MRVPFPAAKMSAQNSLFFPNGLHLNVLMSAALPTAVEKWPELPERLSGRNFQSQKSCRQIQVFPGAGEFFPPAG
jgi:hypothetical protein